MYLWSIRSLIQSLELNCSVVAHDDGTLDNQDYQLIRRSLPGIKIISKTESDKRILEKLADFPRCLEYREHSRFGVKLFNLMLLAESDVILSFDADVLFFRKAEELIEIVKRKSDVIFYNKEDRCHYRSDLALVEQYNLIVDGFNAGLVVYPNPKHYFSLLQVEQVTDWLLENQAQIRFRLGEQIVHAILAGEHHSSPLPSVYSTTPGAQIREDKLVCKHYHSSMKGLFWLEGLRCILHFSPSFLK